MEEFAFSLPISGTISIDGNNVTISVRPAQITMKVNSTPSLASRFSHESGKTIYDIVLETAQQLRREGEYSFTAAQLYELAVNEHPQLKRNSWTSHVIASAPDHPSYKHYASHRDYLDYTGMGKYRLKQQYWQEES